MQRLTFDFNNMFSTCVGSANGVTDGDIAAFSKTAKTAARHLASALKDRESRLRLGLEWANLPWQSPAAVKRIQMLGDEIAARYRNVIFLGIGGSYLGLKAAQDALCLPYYNDFEQARNGRPKIYFEGNNLDPETLSVLLESLDPRRTFCVVISKSGETTETKAAFEVVEQWLKKHCGPRYGRQIFAITDPASGSLRKKVEAAQAKDPLSFRSHPLFKGVGGRYSELNMGLLHLAIAGVKISAVLEGAKDMAGRCVEPDVSRNPAYMYALLHTILFRKKGKPIGIMMPFGEELKSTADWYCQLLAESTGKKFARRIERDASGRELWMHDRKRVLNTGRTPVSTRGTNDLHSVQQNNIEGQNDKVVTFIQVGAFKRELTVPGGKGGLLAGKRYSKLLALAQEATEWALVRESRPNCTVRMPALTPSCWGQLIYFFEMATAFEGELLDINAFDQPGVEGYKNYMYYKLRKPGLAPGIAKDIRSHPLVKKQKYIL
ncbi:MAG: glucose-6-phosphate isomerase [Deltaproteobacteria bacterium]